MAHHYQQQQPQYQQKQKYNKLAGKHVLVIGGSAGIGYAVAEASLESGARVTISSSNPTRLNRSIFTLSSSYPNGRIAGYPCDLSSPDLESNIEALFHAVGGIDHVVFTAGDRLATMPLQEVTLEKIIMAGQIRFFAPLLVAKVGKRYLTPGPESSIILTTGGVAERPHEGWSVVAGYAAGLGGLVRNLAVDMKPVRVNAVSPGLVDTELWAHMTVEQRENMYKSVGEKMLTGRAGKVEDVAEAYLWLMKDANVTGTVATTDSGSKLV